MRRILPGGARLGGSKRGGDERPVACRPLSAVLERTSQCRVVASVQTEQPPTSAAAPSPAASPQKHIERLSTVKLLLEIVAVLVGLIGAVLALIAGFQK